jgi:hypothetical protein
VAYPKTELHAHTRLRKGSCFVLMPFDPGFDRVYHRIVETLEAPGLELVVKRADDFHGANILGTILRSIAGSEFIVADLTGRNANVFYETGIAHSAKEADQVILLTQSIEDVPFDLRHLRHIVYGTGPARMKKLKADLTATFKALLGGTHRLKLREGEQVRLAATLRGRDRNFFELEFFCRDVADDGAKICVRFDEISFDPISEPAADQYAVLSEAEPVLPLEHLPWNLHFEKVLDGVAWLMLERAADREAEFARK